MQNSKELSKKLMRSKVLILRLESKKTYQQIGGLIGISAQRARKIYLDYLQEEKEKAYEQERFISLADSLKLLRHDYGKSPVACLASALNDLERITKERDGYLETCKDLQKDVWVLRKELEIIREHLYKSSNRINE
jgi:hypothetical protein